MSTETTTEHTADTDTRDRISAELRRLVGRPLAEVRVTRVQWPEGKRWVVALFHVDKSAPWNRREIPVPAGRLHRVIALLIRNAFTHAHWGRAQDYDVATGVLTEHVVRMPSCLTGDER
ncbi:hypothetical protein [Streptomyces sp. NPDC045251]|uniref:hypothetical protein n=1 Tax=unclassified Streptomyces TaxID=2593676 RepID=UPI0033FF5A48